MYIQKRLQNSPEAAGKNIISFLCCNYWFIKTFAEPFLNTSMGIQNLIYGTTECVQQSRSRLNCVENLTPEIEEEIDAQQSRFEDERKGRVPPFSKTTSTILARMLTSFAMILSYVLIFVLIYAAFTM
jgi:hypothetical protein